MSTIDAAIIKALVEHVGGDSSCIPDGTIGGGKTYTEGDGINIVNDQISVEYDANTMELKEGKLAAKTQITVGDGLTTSNGKIIANLDTNTMQMNSGKISAKTQLAAGNGISIASGKVNVNYDDATMQLKDGKLAFKADANTLTSLGMRMNLTYSTTYSNWFIIPAETSGQIPIGSVIIVKGANYPNQDNIRKYVIVSKHLDSDGEYYYKTVNTRTGYENELLYDKTNKYYFSAGILHYGDITDEHGVFFRGNSGLVNPNGTEVLPADEHTGLLIYIMSKLSA